MFYIVWEIYGIFFMFAQMADQLAKLFVSIPKSNQVLFYQQQTTSPVFLSKI